MAELALSELKEQNRPLCKAFSHAYLPKPQAGNAQVNLLEEAEQAKDEGCHRGYEKQCDGGGTIQAKECDDE